MLYRLLCLSAHYRSELEFSAENVLAALTRLKRMVMAAGALRDIDLADRPGTGQPAIESLLVEFKTALFDDLNTARALVALDLLLGLKKADRRAKRDAVASMDEVFGLGLLELSRSSLRIRPAEATLAEAEVETRLVERRTARAAKDFARSDAIRDELAAAGIEVMDGDPLGWEWKVTL